MAAMNPTNAIKGTGNAPVVKVGQTADNQHASNPDAKVMGRSASRELNIK